MTSSNCALALLFLASFLSSSSGQEIRFPDRFPRYAAYDPPVPIYAIPGERVIHRFFDASPISPSGRFLAVFRLPYENRPPAPGDAGEVLVIDLQSGKESVVAQSRGWEVQVGANVQWGRSDAELYFNNVDPDTWKAFAVRLNPVTGERSRLEGTVFEASPDGTALISHNLVKSRFAQPGYGVIVPDEHTSRNKGPVAEDGLYLTDTTTGQCRMLVSLQTIFEQSSPSIRIPNPEQFEFYCFQAKWNPQSTRILTSVQWAPLNGGKRQRAVVTMNRDGSDIHTAITAAQWARGGHHINWCPDGVHVSMNLQNDAEEGLEIVTAKFDGSELRTVFKPGSGHPSYHPGGRFLITDAYPYEPVAFGDGSVPIRLIDPKQNTCTNIARIFVSSATGEFRVDPHPAWHGGRYVVFNGYADGTRKVYVADLGPLLANLTLNAPSTIGLDGTALARLRSEPPSPAVLERLRREAAARLKEPFVAVTDKKVSTPSGNPHDYVSLARYWWPNPKTANGLPYVRRDGEVNPENDAYDRPRFESMVKSTEQLSLAAYLTGDAMFSERAARQLRVWFFDERTRMTPHLKHAQLIKGVNDGRGIGLIDVRGLTSVLDSEALLREAGAWSANDHERLTAWFRDYLQWLTTSPNGREEAAENNNHGTWYDVQAASIAMFLGDKASARRICEQAGPLRITKQIDPDGSQPLELSRTLSFFYAVFNLDGLFRLASLGDQVGVDLWHYRTADGRSLRTALDWVIPYATGDKPWRHKQISKPDSRPLVHLLRQAARVYNEPAYENAIVRLPDFGDELDWVNLRYPRFL